MVASFVSTRPLTVPAVPMVASRVAADTTSSPVLATRVRVRVRVVVVVVASAAVTVAAVTTVEDMAVAINSSSMVETVEMVVTVVTPAATMAVVMVSCDPVSAAWLRFSVGRPGTLSQ